MLILHMTSSAVVFCRETVQMHAGHAARLTPSKRCAPLPERDVDTAPRPTLAPSRQHTSADLNSSGISRPQPVRMQPTRDADAVAPVLSEARHVAGPAEPKPYISLQTSVGSAFSALPASPSSPPAL